MEITIGIGMGFGDLAGGTDGITCGQTNHNHPDSKKSSPSRIDRSQKPGRQTKESPKSWKEIGDWLDSKLLLSVHMYMPKSLANIID